MGQAPPSSLTSIEDLSAGSTREAPAVPSGCLVRAATMHILFNDKGPLISRRLVLAMMNQAFKSHEANLQAVVARKLNLPISHVAVKSYMEEVFDCGGKSSNVYHTGSIHHTGIHSVVAGS